MTNSEFVDSPKETLRPECLTSETHPSVRLDERTEPWLVATAGFLTDREFTHDFASGRTYDAPTMMRGYVYQRVVGIESFHRLAPHFNGPPKVAALLGFCEGVPSGDTFREWWQNRLMKRWRDAIETVVAKYFRPELADHPERAPDDRPVMPVRSFAKAFYQFDPDKQILTAEISLLVTEGCHSLSQFTSRITSAPSSGAVTSSAPLIVR